jgi:hypothetical protein
VFQRYDSADSNTAKRMFVYPELRIFCLVFNPSIQALWLYKGADKSLARPERKQATATEDFEFHVSYL